MVAKRLPLGGSVTDYDLTVPADPHTLCGKDKVLPLSLEVHLTPIPF
jgi:hypothetical protein